MRQRVRNIVTLVRGTFTLESLILATLSLTLALTSYLAKGWVEKVETAITDRGPRIERLEIEQKFWREEVTKRLERIESKLDRR